MPAALAIEHLSAGEAGLIAFCGFLIVFIVLTILSGMIVVVSKLSASLAARAGAKAAAPQPAAAAPSAAPAVATPATRSDGQVYGGEIKLLGVDEKTAACIMAIVSDETGIPLSQLVFRRIKALEEEK